MTTTAGAKPVMAGWAGHFISKTEAAETEGFTPLASTADIDDSEVVGQSVRFAARIFRDEADPYSRPRTTAIHRATKRTPDLLRYAFTVGELEVTVFESGLELLVRVDAGPDVLRAPEPNRPHLVAAVAERILRVNGIYLANYAGEMKPYDWVFQFPPVIEEGSWFSTNPRTDFLGLWSWASRVDGIVHHGKVYFLAYKVEARTDGRLTGSDPEHWFGAGK